MEQAKFNQICTELCENEGIEEIFLLNPDGEILFKNKDFPLQVEEAKTILKAWKQKEPSLTFQSNRFAILKNDDIQLAAKNIAAGKGNVVGSITKDGNYIVAHTRDEGMILLEWSILINKIAWK